MYFKWLIHKKYRQRLKTRDGTFRTLEDTSKNTVKRTVRLIFGDITSQVAGPQKSCNLNKLPVSPFQLMMRLGK